MHFETRKTVESTLHQGVIVDKPTSKKETINKKSSIKNKKENKRDSVYLVTDAILELMAHNWLYFHCDQCKKI